MSTQKIIFNTLEHQARIQQAAEIRDAAAQLAQAANGFMTTNTSGQPISITANNGEEDEYSGAERHFTNFTKGLAHDDDGFIKDANDFVDFAASIRDVSNDEKSDAINQNFQIGDRVHNNLVWRFYNQAREVYNASTDETPTAVTQGEAVEFNLKSKAEGGQHRRWEAPTAGVVFELQGPDPYATYMPPAPTVVEGEGENLDANPEMVAEMAELYWLALLRDTPFRNFDEVTVDDADVTANMAANQDARDVQQAVDYLSQLEFYQGHENNAIGKRQRRTGDSGLNRNSIFRGQTAGDIAGPYLSQFLLMGTPRRDGAHEFNEADYASGKVNYGSICMDLQVRQATPKKDYMTHWNEWLDVQNGADVRDGMQTYVSRDRANSKRFMATPRDLATYVHFDALYEAYLNACIMLLEMGAPVDPGFARLNKGNATQGFALFGGPHILTLVTEVATRALKAVRFQKFNVHMRARPEVLAARIAYRLNGNVDQTEKPLFYRDMGMLANALNTGVFTGNNGTAVNLLRKVANHNVAQNLRHDEYLNNGTGLAGQDDLPLLPMAFPEGSPMHPSYGAGHATVAGACVTMLKAFFDTRCYIVWDHEDPNNERNGQRKIAFIQPEEYKESLDDPHCRRYTPVAFVPSADGLKLDDVGYKLGEPLTLEGELNKLAANISIGRNMAGVHYYSDYIDSLRMGEYVAAQILQEQALTYRNDSFCFSFPPFDDQDAGGSKVAHVKICTSGPLMPPQPSELDQITA